MSESPTDDDILPKKGPFSPFHTFSRLFMEHTDVRNGGAALQGVTRACFNKMAGLRFSQGLRSPSRNGNPGHLAQDHLKLALHFLRARWRDPDGMQDKEVLNVVFNKMAPYKVQQCIDLLTEYRHFKVGPAGRGRFKNAASTHVRTQTDLITLDTEKENHVSRYGDSVSGGACADVSLPSSMAGVGNAAVCYRIDASDSALLPPIPAIPMPVRCPSDCASEVEARLAKEAELGVEKAEFFATRAEFLAASVRAGHAGPVRRSIPPAVIDPSHSHASGTDRPPITALMLATDDGHHPLCNIPSSLVTLHPKVLNTLDALTTCTYGLTEPRQPSHRTGLDESDDAPSPRDSGGGTVLWTYDVVWEDCDDIMWGSAWDVFLEMDSVNVGRFRQLQGRFIGSEETSVLSRRSVVSHHHPHHSTIVPRCLTRATHDNVIENGNCSKGSGFAMIIPNEGSPVSEDQESIFSRGSGGAVKILYQEPEDDDFVLPGYFFEEDAKYIETVERR